MKVCGACLGFGVHWVLEFRISGSFGGLRFRVCLGFRVWSAFRVGEWGV